MIKTKTISLQSFVWSHKLILGGCLALACVDTPKGLPDEGDAPGSGGMLHDSDPSHQPVGGDGNHVGGQGPSGMGGAEFDGDPELERCFYAGEASGMGGASSGASVAVSSHPFLGEVLVRGDGLTLYTYGGDRPGTCDAPPLSGCSADCAIAWPPVLVDAAEPPEGLDSADFGVFEREDGALQSSYRGWPLYLFVKDEQAGDVNGQGKGSIWHAASPRVTEITILRNAENEKFLVDDSGFTLYVLSLDQVGDGEDDPVSLCRGDCRKSFVPFRGKHLTVATSLNATDFEVFTSPGVGRQVAYRGQPLYSYVGDEKPFDVNGLQDSEAAVALF